MDDETEEFTQGYEAYKKGELRTSNPYSDETEKFQQYDDGWLWAKQQIG